MIKITIKESFSKAKHLLKTFENDIYLSNDRYNDVYIITHENMMPKLKSLLNVLNTEPISNEFELAIITQEISKVNKEFFGNHHVLES